MPRESFAAYAERSASDRWRQTLVFESADGVPQATGSLLLQSKLTVSGRTSGLIEDVVVGKAVRGQKLGTRILKVLISRARESGCLDCGLNCNEKNIGFYRKQGFRSVGRQMALYFGGVGSKKCTTPPKLSEKIAVRLMCAGDYAAFAALLRRRTGGGVGGLLSREVFDARFGEIKKRGEYHSVYVVETASKDIVASGALLIEDKLTHAAGRVGHVNDLAIDAKACSEAGRTALIRCLAKAAKIAGCYKCIANSSDAAETATFKKCGFEQREISARLTFDSIGEKKS